MNQFVELIQTNYCQSFDYAKVFNSWKLKLTFGQQTTLHPLAVAMAATIATKNPAKASNESTAITPL